MDNATCACTLYHLSLFVVAEASIFHLCSLPLIWSKQVQSITNFDTRSVILWLVWVSMLAALDYLNILFIPLPIQSMLWWFLDKLPAGTPPPSSLLPAPTAPHHHCLPHWKQFVVSAKSILCPHDACLQLKSQSCMSPSQQAPFLDLLLWLAAEIFLIQCTGHKPQFVLS